MANNSADELRTGMAPIYLDIASIHNDILKRHPEITKSSGYLDHSTSTTFAVISDMSKCRDGHEIEIASSDFDSYFGFKVEIVRWRERK